MVLQEADKLMGMLETIRKNTITATPRQSISRLIIAYIIGLLLMNLLDYIFPSNDISFIISGELAFLIFIALHVKLKENGADDVSNNKFDNKNDS